MHLVPRTCCRRAVRSWTQNASEFRNGLEMGKAAKPFERLPMSDNRRHSRT
jgi:hypothetical protein